MPINDTRGLKPQPTKLCLLEQVEQQELGTKIRFLGCVHAYQIRDGILLMKLEYPSSQTRVPTVAVKLDNVLESVNHELTEVGAWLNIIGVVERPVKISRRRKTTDETGQQQPSRRPRLPVVSATMLWSAGAIKLDEYQAAARGFQETITLPG